MKNYDTIDLSKPSTYDNDSELATLVRRVIAPAHHKDNNIGIGEFKRRALAGEFPEIVRSYVVKKSADTVAHSKSVETGIDAANSFDLPEGYHIEVEVGTLLIFGSFDEDLHARLKRVGGYWDGQQRQNRRCWVIDAVKGKSLKRIFANWAKAAQIKAEQQKCDSERRETEKWLGYAEEDARKGWDHSNAIKRALAITDQKYSDRVNALSQRVQDNIKANDDAKAARKAQYAEERAEQQSERDKRHSYRALYPVANLPEMNIPVRRYGKVVVFTGAGNKFRISEDHPSIFGSHLLGYEGDYGCYCYYRDATAEESAHLESKARKKEAEMASAKAREVEIESIRKHIMAHGEQPAGSHAIDGTRYLNTQNLYGGGDWFEVTNTHIWYVKNNGMDGDDWSRNNVRTGGAGAIGWRINYVADIAESLKKMNQ
jgi:hypothetical protein